MEKKGTFTAIVEGKEITFEILLTFDNEETKKSYVIYTDNSKDEMGNTNVFASRYKKDDRGVQLFDLKTNKEWEQVEKVLQQIQLQAKDAE